MVVHIKILMVNYHAKVVVVELPYKNMKGLKYLAKILLVKLPYKNLYN